MRTCVLHAHASLWPRGAWGGRGGSNIERLSGDLAAVLPLVSEIGGGGLVSVGKSLAVGIRGLLFVKLGERKVNAK